MFSNLSGFNQSFLSRNRRFSVESPFRKPAKTSENSKQNFPLFSFLAIMTLECAHVFCPHGKVKSPLNKLFTLWGRPFHSSKKARAKACLKSSLLGKHIRDFCLQFQQVFKGFSKGLILENCLQILNGVNDFS